MKRALILLLLPLTVLADDFKLVGENDRFTFKVDLDSVAINVYEKERAVSAIVRLEYHKSKIDPTTHKKIVKEDFGMSAICPTNKVKVRWVRLFGEDNKVFAKENINDYIFVGDMPDNELSVAKKFYDVSCEVKKPTKRQML